jgi:hypothetical protein
LVGVNTLPLTGCCSSPIPLGWVADGKESRSWVNTCREIRGVSERRGDTQRKRAYCRELHPGLVRERTSRVERPVTGEGERERWGRRTLSREVEVFAGRCDNDGAGRSRNILKDFSRLLVASSASFTELAGRRGIAELRS